MNDVFPKDRKVDIYKLQTLSEKGTLLKVYLYAVIILSIVSETYTTITREGKWCFKYNGRIMLTIPGYSHENST